MTSYSIATVAVLALGLGTVQVVEPGYGIPDGLMPISLQRGGEDATRVFRGLEFEGLRVEPRTPTASTLNAGCDFCRTPPKPAPDKVVQALEMVRRPAATSSLESWPLVSTGEVADSARGGPSVLPGVNPNGGVMPGPYALVKSCRWSEVTTGYATNPIRAVNKMVCVPDGAESPVEGQGAR